MKKEADLFYEVFESPLGPLWMVSGREGLSYLLWHRSESGMRAEIQSRAGRLPQKQTRHTASWRADLKRYFSGQEVLFRGEIAFLEGTSFQQAVWRSLLHIPYGQVTSYRSIADQINKPGASRAVGNACGKNPLPIVVPCHRVLRQDGRLGGYTGGVEIKTRLLKIEGVL